MAADPNTLREVQRALLTPSTSRKARGAFEDCSLLSHTVLNLLETLVSYFPS